METSNDGSLVQDEHPRLDASARAIATLPLATGEHAGQRPLFPLAQADLVEQLPHPPPLGLGGEREVPVQHLGYAVAHPDTWIK